jgi:hypothetical protein
VRVQELGKGNQSGFVYNMYFQCVLTFGVLTGRSSAYLHV